MSKEFFQNISRLIDLDREKEAIGQKVLQFMETAELKQEHIDQFYWYTDLPTRSVAKRLGVHNLNLRVSEEYHITCTCNRCGAQFYKALRSRTHFKEIQRIMGDLVCSDCYEIIQEEQKRLEIEREKQWKKQCEERTRQFALKLNHLKTMPYGEYLKTEHWQNVKTRALKRAKNTCQLCGASGLLNVHHRTYINRGQEENSDVIVLCRDCHAKFHGKLAK